MYLRCTGKYECDERQEAGSDLPCRQKKAAIKAA
jgi:hypothetical protein